MSDPIRDFVIAVDGPSGSGKTTTAKRVAQRLGLRHIDTGAMYRAVTLVAWERGIDAGDAERLGALARELEIDVAQNGDGSPRVSVGARDVTAEVRAPAVTAGVSAVSAHRAVRAAMVQRQRELASGGGVILEGRDIGSVVLPWADVKIYLDASVRVRAVRRQAELAAAGTVVGVDEVERDLQRRDTLDASREDSPLVRPIGAWVVDTSDVSIEEQVERVMDLVRAAARERAEQRPDIPPARRKRLVWILVTGAIAWMYTLVFGLRVRRAYRGVPGENYLFASNHLAYSDPPVVGCRLPREIHFVAKDSLFRKPVFGRVIAYFNAFPIRRGVFDREAMAIALQRLLAGHSVMIFPEGGRVAGGELGTGRGGVGYLAIRSGVPVVPLYVSGTDRLHDCLLRRARLTVVHGRPIRIPRALLAEYRAGEDRMVYRRYSEMVMAGIQALKEMQR